VIIDMRGRKCPAPIIALGKQSRLTPGATVSLLADDPAADFDVPAWCRMAGGELLSTAYDDAAASPRYEVVLPGRRNTGGIENSAGSSDS
jgi:tRNA 2-thiouridine synthesizing protein A